MSIVCLLASAIRLTATLAIEPFHPGERVALLGDSITHHGYLR